MWDFFETVRHRHSVRSYQADMPVEKEKLHALLEMASAAPSAGDLQSYRIVVVQAQSERQALREAADDQRFIAEAPVCLVFCSDSHRSEEEFGERGAHLYSLQDATIAAAYAQLAAVAVGLGSTWVGRFDEGKVQQLLDLEPELHPVALLSIGYPAELPHASSRRPLNEMVQFRTQRD
jgi:nitroreductase